MVHCPSTSFLIIRHSTSFLKIGYKEVCSCGRGGFVGPKTGSKWPKSAHARAGETLWYPRRMLLNSWFGRFVVQKSVRPRTSATLVPQDRAYKEH